MLKKKDENVVEDIREATEEENMLENNSPITEKLDIAFGVITNKVLKLPAEECVLTAYKQKAVNTVLTVATSDFEVTVLIKDNERWGL